MEMENKNILVSGGLGFIGYHLCSRLIELEPNSKITIIDNLSSTQLDYSPLSNKTQIIIKDFKCFSSVGNDDFDEIYHLASPVGSLGILEKSGYIAKDILDLAENAANIAAKSNAKLLYVSSSEVYGKDGLHSENCEIIVPQKYGTRMEYSLGKLTAEHMLLNLAYENDFQVRIVRPFNAMGEWQCSQIGFVIPTFFEAALNGRNLTVHGDGQQLRSFCHINDLVNGIISIQANGTHNTIYNVGHPDNVTSIIDLAHTIKDICNSNSKVTHIDPRKVYGTKFIEAFNKIPNIDKTKKHTDWKPHIGLSEGLQRIYKHYDRISTDPTDFDSDSYSLSNNDVYVKSVS
jgi:nucleoside-diphosphate-sugar epimerase